MKKNIRWCFALILLILFSFTPFTEAMAAPELEVKATAGFQNKVKYGLGLPLSMTVVNNGDEFSGDLVIDYSESYAVGSAKAIPFTIGKGETKTINLSLSGLSDEYMYSGGTNSNQMFYFYEGGWEKDKEVKYKGNKSLRPTFYGQETNFILTLTESADRLRPFSAVKLNNMSDTQVIHLAQLKDFEFPVDASSYGVANFLVVDEFVLADLPADAQKAILEWVQTGGVVIVGASENTSAELGLLSSELPLTLSDERIQIPKEVFATLTKNKGFTQDISAFNATVNESSRVLWASENQPLSAVNSIGKGAIIQTAFSIGDEPFSKESSATAFLTELIKKANVGMISTTNMNNGYQGMKEQMVYDVGQTNELFPSFQVSTSIMVAIVILYIILIGPLMYFLLKRKDKREHAWWIIPAISILTSAAIFAYGAKDRLVRPQIQQSSFYEVQDDASLTGYYVESLLSNRSGDFTFESDTGTSMVASKQMNAFSGSTGSAQATSILQEHANKDQLTMRDVGYWSVSTILGDSHIPDVGKFTIDLTVENGNVRGTVKNDFPFSVKEVSIWSGTKMINLGDLNPSESVNVAEPIGSALLLPIASTTGTQYMGYGSPMTASDLPKERKNSLIRMTQTMGNRSTQPAIIAHTEDAIVPLSLVDARAEISAVNVIFQKFEPKTIFSGEFTLPATSFEISVNNEDPSAHFEQMSESKFEWYMPNGAYLYDWKVPPNVPLDQVNWTELQLANTNTTSITVSIYNVSTKTFEEVTGGRFSINENVQDYISTEGIVQFNVNKQASNGDDYTRLPELRLKGEVKK
ncbi:hypothetical protein [Paenisporosarcina indica]|uniref:hypothetical protein n=1 Tax=Paenisporosarcina indica TaxID=650093 RepID=UPI000950278B|nr:hypothetical protein [Paenisporosarcina indica]